MANKFKYNKTGTETNSIFKGNWAIDTTAPNSGGGPSNETGLYMGAKIPENGYVVYSSNGVYHATTDNELLGKVRDLGGDWSSVSAALTWSQEVEDVIILNKTFDDKVTNGLILNLDSSNISSYVDSQPTENLISYIGGYATVSWPSSAYRVHIKDRDVLDSSAPGGQFSRVTGIDGSDNNQCYFIFRYGGIAVHGEEITLSMSLKGTGTCHLTLYDDVQGYSTSPTITLTSDWVRHEYTATAAQYNTNCWVALRGILNTTDVSFAAVQAERKSSASPFVDGTRLHNTTLYDLTNADRHTTLFNGVSFDGKSFVFDGTNDYIEKTGLGSEFQISQGSIEAWIKPSSDGTDQMVCGLGGGHTYGASRIIRINGNQWGFVGYGSGTEDWGSIAPVEFNKWAHVVITWNGTTICFYLNGIKYTTIKTGAVTPNSSVIRLGSSTWNSSDRPFEGNISDFKVYNRTLNNEEVNRNYYSANLVNTVSTSVIIDPSNPISLEDNPTAMKDLVNSVDWVIEGTGSKIEDNNGVLRLNAGRIYAPTTGWYGKMATSWWMRWTGPKAAGTFYTESYRNTGGCARINSYMNGNGTFRFSVWDNSSYSDPNLNGTISVTTTTDVCDGNWHHITCQWSNGSGNIDRGMYVYVNGILESSADAIGNDGGYQHMHLGGVSGCVGEVTSTVDFGPILQYKNYNLSHEGVYQNYTAYAARFK